MSSVSKNLERSKSMCSLHEVEAQRIKEVGFPDYRVKCSRRISDSSVEVYVVNDSDSDVSLEDSKRFEDSGIGTSPGGGETLKNLEVKIDRLSDLILEQCRLLSAIKEEIQDSKFAVEKSGLSPQLVEQLTAKAISITQGIKELTSSESDPKHQNPRATSLLNAIEFKQAVSLDREVRDALTQFLQNDQFVGVISRNETEVCNRKSRKRALVDLTNERAVGITKELKDRMVTATAESVKEVIRGCLSKDMADIYLPTLERSHRRLLRHMSRVLADAFVQYENSAMFMKHTHRASRGLRRALEQHELLLQNSSSSLSQVLHDTIEQFLKNELKEWRQKVLEILSSPVDEEPEEEAPPQCLECVPTSPPQPADPEMSIIDQLMQSAEINKLIQDGDVNGSFARALSASELSLVMAACRAADPAKVFAQPCLLEQSVLLSLVQQLATDMVHDTQLKCRYLEDALIHLNTSNPGTRAHLPLVVGEVRKHLMKFLHAYPSHVASRRISLIVMAADNLLK